MKCGKTFTLMLVLSLFIFPMISADVITPTKTNVYFEKNGQSYNKSIEFTVKGYGYSYPIGPPVEKEPGTYTPEVVYSFSATYNNYGDEIDENYYQNYIHIDYYELEGKTADGKTFVIKDIESIPTNCVENNPQENNKYQTCLANLEKPDFVDPSTQPAGTTREDYKGRIWTKGEDGLWTTQNTTNVNYTTCQVNNMTKPDPNAVIISSEKNKTYTSFEDSENYEIGAKRTDSEGNIWIKGNSSWYREVTTTCFMVNKTQKINTRWGDIMWEEMDKEIYEYEEAKEKCENILENLRKSEDYYVLKCELRFDLDDVTWSEAPEPQGFWNKVGCFFKRLFSGSC